MGMEPMRCFIYTHYLSNSKTKAMIFLVAIGLCMALQPLPGYAEDLLLDRNQKQQKSPKDDPPASNRKWIPVPMFLTEPAFGYGLGLGLGYIHPRKNEEEDSEYSTLQIPKSFASNGDLPNVPPNITGVAVGYTEKKTWFVGLGHTESWRNDTLRYAGGVAYGDVKTSYYIRDLQLKFDLVGLGIYQDIKFRLGGSNFFLAANCSIWIPLRVLILLSMKI